jgi:glycine/D-amino acid oxidase-like deaminating enzyme/nitrite reductase/ring-hydroxylating ferredoxin subunit
MNTVSLWKDITKDRPSYPKLDTNIEADVVIIGGGITGVTCAYRLTRAGKKVVLLEAQSISGGTTGYSTGNLYVATQPYYTNIESKFDLETVKAVAHSRRYAIDFIENTVNEHNIDCGFMRRPWYLYSSGEKEVSKVEDEVDVLIRAGINVEFTESMPIPVKFERAAVMQNQARFNPFRYVVDLAKAAAGEGCLIFEDSPITEMKQDDNDCCTAVTEGGTVTAEYMIMATHLPKGINNIQFVAMPYRSYVVAAKLKGKAPNGNFWDMDTPHHVTSSHPSRAGSMELDLLMVAGAHHKVGQPQEETIDHYHDLEKYLYKNYDVEKIAYRWSAQHYKSADYVPYIGKSPGGSENSYIATGFFADGLVYGTIAGVIIPDHISGTENAWNKIYDASRFTPLKSAAETIKENVNEVMQYLKDVPWNVDAEKFSEVKNGQGKIMMIDGEKYGVYRDESGKLHVVSAVCTHLACIVEWNNAERSWDCPCHGSRFTYEGKVIEGPAMYDLKKRM